MKRKGKTPKDRAWDAFSLYIRERDAWRCCTCGAVNYRNKSGGPIMQAGHLITRQRAATLYDEENVFCQCAPCNNRHRFFPEIMTGWYLTAYGKPKYDDLCRKARKLCRRRASDYNAIRFWYDEKRAELLKERK